MVSSLLSNGLQALRSPRTLALLGAGAVAAAGYAWWSSTRVEPSEEELERARRDYLATYGRLIDGSITEAHWRTDTAEPTPAIIVYRYRIAGVSYECAQDVFGLPDLVRHLRIDLPVQVRFDHRNPGDSIVVAEAWSGVRVDRAQGRAALSRTEAR